MNDRFIVKLEENKCLFCGQYAMFDRYTVNAQFEGYGLFISAGTDEYLVVRMCSKCFEVESVTVQNKGRNERK